MSRVASKTNDLINNLASDLEPVKVMGHPLKRALPWLSFIALYVSLTVLYLGIRGDFSDKMTESLYLFEMGLVISMSLSAALCSLWMCVPDMRGQKWLLTLSLTLFAVVASWIAVQAFMDMDHIPYDHWSHCFEDAVLFGSVPVAAFLFMSLNGKTTYPNLKNLMNILAVSGIGYIGLRITCASDDIGHICVFHILPYIILGGIIGVVGRKIYRW